MARPAVMPFKNVDGETCFACGATENTRWYCAYDPARFLLFWFGFLLFGFLLWHSCFSMVSILETLVATRWRAQP